MDSISFINGIVYLDNAATTPCDPRVIDAMHPYWFNNFGNPSSPHILGQLAKQVIEDCRCEINEYLHGSGTIICTSGSTESNNLAILSAFKFTKEQLRRRKVLCLSTEHKSIINSVQYYGEQLNIEVIWIPVTPTGIIDMDWLFSELDHSVGAVIVQLANSETGVIQDIRRISEACHQVGAVCVSDITQAIGKIKVNIDYLGIDFATFTAHKFYGPKGIGALYVSPRMKVAQLIYGGGQEKGVRPGTENVAGLVGMTTALRLCIEEHDIMTSRVNELRNSLFSVLERVGDIRWNGMGAPLLPSHLNITISGVNAQDLMLRSRNIAFSAGSACNTATNLPSPVLLSMGMTKEEAEQTIRLTIGRFNTEQEIEIVSKLLILNINDIRNLK